jgi:DNA-binding transcriptional LysR family regulator
MTADLADLSAFVAVVRTGGFRETARISGGVSVSSLSQGVRRLEAKLGVRLLNRTTRSVAPTEAGARLFERLVPALNAVETAIGCRERVSRPAGGNTQAQCPR